MSQPQPIYFPIRDMIDAIDHALAIAPPTVEPEPLADPAGEYFDGESIDETRVKLTACSNLDTTRGFRLEEDVVLLVKAQVTGIDHRVDKRTGNLIRLHTLTVTQIVPDEKPA